MRINPPSENRRKRATPTQMMMTHSRSTKVQTSARGWADNVENIQGLLNGITCFTTQDDRFTAIDDQDCIAIDQMVRFADKELEALAKQLQMAGDYRNPRVVTCSGYVWSLDSLSATLTEMPEGGGA